MSFGQTKEETVKYINSILSVSKGIEHIGGSGSLSNAFIVTNHLSSDNTEEIVRSYPEVVCCINEKDEAYHQSVWVTKMAHIAVDLKADWIVHIDADEFWYGFKTLQRVPSNIGVVYSGSSCNPFLSNGKSCRDFLPMVNQKEETDFCFSQYKYFKYSEYKPCRGVKIVHRPSKSCVVDQGNHDIKNMYGEKGFTDKIHIDHYPVRSYEHFLRKVKNGGESYEKTKDLDYNVGIHWRKWYEKFLDKSIKKSYEDIAIHDSQINDLIEKKIIFKKQEENWSGIDSWTKIFN